MEAGLAASSVTNTYGNGINSSVGISNTVHYYSKGGTKKKSGKIKKQDKGNK